MEGSIVHQLKVNGTRGCISSQSIRTLPNTFEGVELLLLLFSGACLNEVVTGGGILGIVGEGMYIGDRRPREIMQLQRVA